jgi:hypothetical protein
MAGCSAVGDKAALMTTRLKQESAAKPSFFQ